MSARIAFILALVFCAPSLAQAGDCPGTRRQATAAAVAKDAGAAVARAEARARRTATKSCARRGKALAAIDMKSSVQPKDGWFRGRAAFTYGCFSR